MSSVDIQRPKATIIIRRTVHVLIPVIKTNDTHKLRYLVLDTALFPSMANNDSAIKSLFKFKFKF